MAQAYEGWQQQSQNRQLYIKTREAFRKSWFALPTNHPCSYYTKEVLGQALAEPRVIISFKAQAASVMIQVLEFAHFAEPKYNPKPDFTMSDLMEYTTPTERSEEIEVKREEVKSGEVKSEEIEVKSEIPQTTKQDNMEEKKVTKGRAARPVCQIDPKTKEVINTFDSCSEACRAAGVKNIDRAIKKLQMAGGYYWQYPEDVKTFAERLEEKATCVRHTPPIRNASHDALEVFTDEELINELTRRGWEGELSRRQVVVLGR